MDKSDLDGLHRRLDTLESMLKQLQAGGPRQAFYSTAQAAELLDRAEWTVRSWCRLGRVRAEKRPSGRGPAGEWMISHEELERIRSEGLLPIPAPTFPGR